MRPPSLRVIDGMGTTDRGSIRSPTEKRMDMAYLVYSALLVVTYFDALGYNQSNAVFMFYSCVILFCDGRPG